MDHIVALDQGSTSTRAIVFDRTGLPVSSAQVEHEQHFAQPGWIAHDPAQLWKNSITVIDDAMRAAGLDSSRIAALGITNQRETTVVWDRLTGRAIDEAIVWQDTRTQSIVEAVASSGGRDRFAALTGLPLATYFSASKLRWLLDRHPEHQSAAAAGDVLGGTIDSWLLWNFTGGVAGGVHSTDVTNASRTLLMDLATLDWAEEPLAAFGIPRAMLPSIRPSSGDFGVITADCALKGVPIMGMLGDQQAAAFGQAAFDSGDSKNTYGTGNFLLVNTGDAPVRSESGLLTTVAYQREGHPASFALEGSIAVTGSLVQWLRDNLGIISHSSDVEALAASVPDSGDVYFVPAFSGLFAPYWRADARGAIVGLTRFAHRGHIARAALESTAFQTVDVVRAVEKDLGHPIRSLRVDGGMVANELLMQFQADVLGVAVVRPAIAETTALGAAYAAGLAAGLWSGLDEVRSFWREDRRWAPQWSAAERGRRTSRWASAVERSLGWAT